MNTPGMYIRHYQTKFERLKIIFFFTKTCTTLVSAVTLTNDSVVFINVNTYVRDDEFMGLYVLHTRDVCVLSGFHA